MEKDANRAAYEAALKNLVGAVHDLGVAFEAASLAGLAWDPTQTHNEPDAAQHAAAMACSSLMMSIVGRHAGAAQMLGVENMIAQAIARAVATAAPDAVTPGRAIASS